MSVAMFFITTIAILFSFYLLEPTKLHLCFICTLSLLGYGGSYCFYQEAKDGNQDYTLLLFGVIFYIVTIFAIV